MSSAELGRKGIGNRMPLYNWAVANLAARDAITEARPGVALSSLDVGRVCRVGGSSPYLYYVLEGVSPMSWSRAIGAEDQVGGGGGGGGVTDHGALSGLGDNDHPQYALADDVATALAGKAASSHNQAISTVTGLQAALDSKAEAIHAHSVSDVTGLQSQLDAINSTLSGLGGSYSETAVAAASYTFGSTDATKTYFVTSHAGPEIPFTIPADATYNFAVGKEFKIRWGGVGRPGLVPATGVTLTSPGQWRAAAPGAELVVRKVAANTWRVVSGYAVLRGLGNLSASLYSQNNTGTFVAGSASGFHAWIIYTPYKLPVSQTLLRKGNGSANGYQISSGGGGQLFGQVANGSGAMVTTPLLAAFAETDLGKPCLLELVSTGTTINIYKNGVAAGTDVAISGYTAPVGAALIAGVGGILGLISAWGGGAQVPTSQNLLDHYTQCKLQNRGVANPAGSDRVHNAEGFGYIYDEQGSGERFSLEGSNGMQFVSLAGAVWS
jgi:hypothetical protein